MSFTPANIGRFAFFLRQEKGTGNPFSPFFLTVLFIGREERREGGRKECKK